MSVYYTYAQKLFASINVLDPSNFLQYYPSAEFDLKRYHSLLRRQRTDKLIDEKYAHDNLDLKEFFESAESLGEYEAVILRRMLFPNYTEVNVICGAIGSGKSTTFQFINHYFRHHLRPNYRFGRIFPVYVDLNSVGTIDHFENQQQYIVTIFKDIKQKIENELVDKYRGKEGFNVFWQRVVEYGVSNPEHTLIRQVNNRVDLETSSSKLVQILEVVDHYEAMDQCKFWMLLLSVDAHLSGSPIDNYILVDNVDQHGGAVQNAILGTLQPIGSLLKNVHIFVTMRIISFRDMWSTIPRSMIPNCSLLPTIVLENRIRDFLMMLAQGTMPSVLPRVSERELAVIVVWFCEIYQLLKRRNSQFSQSLNAVCGFSIRRALAVMCRAFEPEVGHAGSRSAKIDYYLQSHSLVTDLLGGFYKIETADQFEKFAERCFYSSRDLVIEPDPDVREMMKVKDRFFSDLLFMSSFQSGADDQLVENLLLNEKDEFTFLKIRVLQYLKRNKLTVKVSQLVQLISMANGHNLDAFMSCLNSLSRQNKRLVYFDGPLQVYNLDTLNSIGNNYITLTQAGAGYIEFMTKNFAYINRCLLQHELDTRKMSVFDQIRVSIQNTFEIIDLDTEEVTLLKQRLPRKEARKQVKRLESVQILVPYLSHYRLKALETYAQNPDLSPSTKYLIREICLDIESKVTLIKLNSEELFGRYPKQMLADLIKAVRLIRKHVR